MTSCSIRKFGKNLNANHTPQEIAKAASVRIMLEEHFFWYCKSLQIHCIILNQIVKMS